MKLTIEIDSDVRGGYRAWCPALPGCTVCGQTQEDAHRRIEEAIRGYLASMDVALPLEINGRPHHEVALLAV